MQFADWEDDLLDSDTKDQRFGTCERVIALLANEFARRSDLETHVIMHRNNAPFVDLHLSALTTCDYS